MVAPTCALLACRFSRPLTRRDATALLGVYLFLIIFVPIGLQWALGPYIEPGLWGLALLRTIFFAMAYVKRVAKGEQDDLSALRNKVGPVMSGAGHSRSVRLCPLSAALRT